MQRYEGLLRPSSSSDAGVADQGTNLPVLSPFTEGCRFGERCRSPPPAARGAPSSYMGDVGDVACVFCRAPSMTGIFSACRCTAVFLIRCTCSHPPGGSHRSGSMTALCGGLPGGRGLAHEIHLRRPVVSLRVSPFKMLILSLTDLSSKDDTLIFSFI